MAYARIRPRRGTATQWATANPILVEGEIGIEVPDTGVGTGLVKMKFGDGVNAWNDLPYGFEGGAGDIIVQTLDGDETDKVPSVSAIVEVLKDVGTIRYNVETDYVQILVSGEWVDWNKVGISWDGLLYDNGSFVVGFDRSTDDWNYSSTRTLEDSYVSESNIAQTASGKTTITLIGTTNTIDVTKYDTMKVEYTNNNTEYTLELDLSSVSGSYYLGVVSYIGTTTTVIGLFVSTSKQNVDSSKIAFISKDNLTSTTNYITKIQLS